MAMALGGWDRGKEKVIGGETGKEGEGGELAAHWGPAGRQSPGRTREGESPGASCQGRPPWSGGGGGEQPLCCVGRAGPHGTAAKTQEMERKPVFLEPVDRV